MKDAGGAAARGETTERRPPGRPGRAGGRVFATANVLMLLAFAFSVVVQVNDPDPLPWIAVYGLAAAACVLAVLGRGGRRFPAAVGVVAAAWAATFAPRVVGRVRFLDMFGAFEMANVGIEESREMYGLLIVAAWMGVLAVRGGRSNRRGGPAGADVGDPPPRAKGDQ